MLHQRVERHGSIGGQEYRRELALLFSLIGPDQGRLVGSGFNKVLGSLLDWPEWMFEGTSIKPSAALPRKIRLADDLIILANIADCVGPEFILASLASRPSHASSPAMYAFLMSAPTLLHAMQFAVEVLQFQNPHLRFVLSRTSPDRMELRSTLVIEGKFAEFYEFAHLSVFAGLASHLVLQEECIGTLELHGAEPAWRDSIQKLPSAVTFVESDQNRLVVPSDWADRRIPYHDPTIWRAAKDRLASLRGAYEQADLLMQIDAEVEHILSKERRTPSMAEVARIVGLSQRTLTRRLSIAGCTFRQRVDVARRNLAETMLQESDRPIASIARSLGFSHSSSFARAFAVWTGSSPRKWRSENSAGKPIDRR